MIQREVPLTVAYKAIRYCGYSLCILFVYFCVSMLFGKQLDRANHCQMPSSSRDIYIEWGTPPNFFSLDKQSYSIPFSELEKEILFLGMTRERDQKILLSIKQSGVRKLILSGEKACLIYKGGKLYFSETKTPLAISVIPKNDSLVEIIMSFDLPMPTKYNVDSTYHFLKSKENQYTLSNSDPLIDTPMFQSLYNAKWWGVDYLLISNPKNENQSGHSKQRLEIGTEILYLNVGQYLVWEQKGWRALSLGDKDMVPDYVVRIENIYNDKLELTLWDRKGLPIHTFFLPFYTTSNELPSIEILSNIKKRTPTVASFLLGKTRVTMKKGDLAIDTPHGWKITSTQEERNGIFSHQMLGSLFAFDGMETQGSTVYFVGRIFDTMRTCYLPVKIPIVQNKRKEREKTNYNSRVEVSPIGGE